MRIRLLVLVLIAFSWSFLMQGCLPAVWLAAVGTDTIRSSEVELQPFENSWVAPSEKWQLGMVQSIAIIPFSGDAAMAARFTRVLRHATDLRVVGPIEVTKHVTTDVVTAMSGSVTEQGDIELARSVTKDLGVDCVLIGSVVEGPSQESFWGLKERLPKRLYLHLVSAEGTVVWKSELPFTVVKGTKPPYEEWVEKALTTHVMAHANQLGLTELWRAKEGRVVTSVRNSLGLLPAPKAPSNLVSLEP